jgi:hypothetical protein
MVIGNLVIVSQKRGYRTQRLDFGFCFRQLKFLLSENFVGVVARA